MVLLENVMGMIDDTLSGREDAINGCLSKNAFAINISTIFELPLTETSSPEHLCRVQSKLYDQYMRLKALSTRAMAIMISKAQHAQVIETDDAITIQLENIRFKFSQDRWISSRCFDINLSHDQLKSAKRQVQRYVYRHTKNTPLTQNALKTLTP